MKNYIPLTVAVLLAVAAAYAVSQLTSQTNRESNQAIVVAALMELEQGSVISLESLSQRVIPIEARPLGAITWSRRSDLVGQTITRTIEAGDYIVESDLDLIPNVSDLIGEGEWAVTINVGNAGMARAVRPGDEVAIIGTFQMSVPETVADLGQAPQSAAREITLVLFPRVRVLDRNSDASGIESGGEFVVALPPQQAQVLIAAQTKAQLSLALRRPGDTSAVNRRLAGLVDDDTFEMMMQDLETVNVPDGPLDGLR